MSLVATQVVEEDETEVRLDRWFRRHFPTLTQGTIQKLCRTGQIRVDGRRAEAATRLLAGQTVRIPPLPAGPPPSPEKPAPDHAALRALEAMVVYRDAQVIAIDKPPGLPTQGGPGLSRHVDGMLDGLREEGFGRPKLVHRLDMDTSGLLLLARTPGVAARLAASFRGRDVQKTYWAVVAGRPQPMHGRIEAPLVRFGGLRGGERVAVAAPGEEEAARAITDYRTLDHAGKMLSWLELKPQTGRTHQLRVHCTALGAPILGDRNYGGERSHVEGFADRLHLHARALTLPHPAGGTLTLEAALPTHMRETFRALGFETPEPAAPSRR